MEVQNKLGFNEVVDTFIDLIKAEVAFRKTVVNGKFDLGRFLITSAGQFPVIEEGIKDFPTFWAEVKDLLALEAAVAYTRIVEGLTAEEAEKSVILDVVLVLTKTYVYADDAVKTAEQFYQKQVAQGKELLALLRNIGQ